MTKALRRCRPWLLGKALLVVLHGLWQATPAHAGSVCQIAQQIVAIEVASRALYEDVPDDFGRVISRISKALAHTDWMAGLEALPQVSRQTARTEVEAFVKSRQRMVAGYRNAGAPGARSVMASTDYAGFDRVIEVLEVIAHCDVRVSVDEAGLGVDWYVKAMSKGQTSPTTAAEPSHLFLLVNIALMIGTLMIAWRFEASFSRNGRQILCDQATILRHGSTETPVTLASLGPREACLVVHHGLEPGAEVALLLDGVWHPASVANSAAKHMAIRFRRCLSRRVVHHCSALANQANT